MIILFIILVAINFGGLALLLTDMALNRD